MNVYDAILKRRSVRKYLEKPLQERGELSFPFISPIEFLIGIV